MAVNCNLVGIDFGLMMRYHQSSSVVPESRTARMSSAAATCGRPGIRTMRVACPVGSGIRTVRVVCRVDSSRFPSDYHTVGRLNCSSISNVLHSVQASEDVHPESTQSLLLHLQTAPS